MWRLGFKKGIKFLWWLITTPSSWPQNYPYCEQHDKYLFSLLAFETFNYVDKFESRLGPLALWTENHPYASFTIYPITNPETKRVRPSRFTIYLAAQKYTEETGHKLYG